jgi:hypothetical protein
MTATLHDCLVWCGVPTKKQRNSEQALESCHRDFRARSVRHHIDHRDNARRREIEIRKLAAGPVQDFAERHRYEVKVGEQSLVDCFRESREQMILPGGM